MAKRRLIVRSHEQDIYMANRWDKDADDIKDARNELEAVGEANQLEVDWVGMKPLREIKSGNKRPPNRPLKKQG